MKLIQVVLTVTTLAMLSACGDNDLSDTEAADNTVAPPGPMTAPTIAQQQPGAAPGVAEVGTMTDPASESCGANKGADIVGQQWSDASNVAITRILPEGGTIRVQEPGGAYTEEYTPNRFNVMLDNSGIVRDLRCG